MVRCGKVVRRQPPTRPPHSQDLDKTTIGSYLGEREDFNIKVSGPRCRGPVKHVATALSWSCERHNMVAQSHFCTMWASSWCICLDFLPASMRITAASSAQQAPAQHMPPCLSPPASRAQSLSRLTPPSQVHATTLCLQPRNPRRSCTPLWTRWTSRASTLMPPSAPSWRASGGA